MQDLSVKQENESLLPTACDFMIPRFIQWQRIFENPGVPFDHRNMLKRVAKELKSLIKQSNKRLDPTTIIQAYKKFELTVPNISPIILTDEIEDVP